MYTHTPTIFNHLLNQIPKALFDGLVGQHQTDRYKKHFTTKSLFVTMLYAQATGKDSLRAIVTGLNTHHDLHYHLWLSSQKSVKRTTIAHGNGSCDSVIFERLFYEMLKLCKQFDPWRKFDGDLNVYSLDSTTIRVSLNLIERAKYQTMKGAIKMHILLQNKSSIPEVITITDGKNADIKIGKLIANKDTLEAWSIVVFDRAYLDYERRTELDQSKISFVSRMKKNIDYLVEDKIIVSEPYVMKDEKISIFNPNSPKTYKWLLRRIEYLAPEDGKRYVFITNNFDLSAGQIAQIYKNRWKIELFFKRIKQNLKIKHFLWTTENAVRNQIRIAMIYYLLLNYIKYKCNQKISLLELTRLFAEALMLRASIIDILWLNTAKISLISSRASPYQPWLF